MSNTKCPLCSAAATVCHAERYYHCSDCDLIFLHRDFHLSAHDEKSQYDLHQNSPDDRDYRQFLNQLLAPLKEIKPPPAKVLDFGCGPGPTVSVMLEESGYDVSLFDPYYYPDETVLKASYNVITLTEVLEHLSQPSQELQKLFNMLLPESYLGIMTALHHGVEKFSNWHYKNDPTHICFYSQDTMQWIARRYSSRIAYLSDRVTILQPGGSG